MIRQPAVAGQFYPEDPARLRKELSGLTRVTHSTSSVIGAISPHAGYVYSGAVAGELFSTIEIPRTVVILGPNHHGIGASAALYPDGEWVTPLGAVPIAADLAALVLRHAPLVAGDSLAHLHEHSLEVQVPFLQFFRPDVAIVPVCLGFSDFISCTELGKGIAAAIREYGEETLIVASSDMTHYESADNARTKDEMALERVLNLDPQGLLEVCRSKRITMCGVVPATVMLIAAMDLGAHQSRLVRYANSGEVNHDYRQVVGYAAVTVS